MGLTYQTQLHKQQQLLGWKRKRGLKKMKTKLSVSHVLSVQLREQNWWDPGQYLIWRQAFIYRDFQIEEFFGKCIPERFFKGWIFLLCPAVLLLQVLNSVCSFCHPAMLCLCICVHNNTYTSIIGGVLWIPVSSLNICNSLNVITSHTKNSFLWLRQLCFSIAFSL